MELNVFIKKVLSEIIAGIIAAQKEMIKSGVAINPPDLANESNSRKHLKAKGHLSIQDIEIAVSVVVSEPEENKIDVLLYNVTTSKKPSETLHDLTAAVHTIRLKIPVAIPTLDIPTMNTSDELSF